MSDLMELLQAGGNVSLIGMLLFLWRLDRRIHALEIIIKLKGKNNV